MMVDENCMWLRATEVKEQMFIQINQPDLWVQASSLSQFFMGFCLCKFYGKETFLFCECYSVCTFLGNHLTRQNPSWAEMFSLVPFICGGMVIAVASPHNAPYVCKLVGPGKCTYCVGSCEICLVTGNCAHIGFSESIDVIVLFLNNFTCCQLL